MMSAARGVLRIELSDPAIEDWITVDRALDFIVNGQFDDARIKHTVSVCLFFKKYNCAASMKQFIFCIKHAPFAPRVKTFIVGACLDDEDMCLMALKYPLPSWEKHEGASEVGREGNSVPLAGCQFNTGSWAMCWASATPTQYKWALDRAWFRAGNTAANFPNFASEFKTLLTRAKGEPVHRDTGIMKLTAVI